MRVLVIGNMYPPHHYGGYELSCRDVMDRWRAAGHEVTVLTTDLRVPGVPTPAAEGAYVRRDLQFYWDDHVVLSPPVWRRFAMERANQRALRAAIRAARPHLVSVWNMGAMSLGLLTTLVDHRVPMLLVVCDDWLEYAPHLDAWSRLFRGRPRVGRVVERLTAVPTRLPDLEHGASTVFVSARTRDHATVHGAWRFPTAPVVPSGFDAADFPVLDAPPATRDWAGRLLYVGRIDSRKGIATAIRALAALPDTTRLDVLGSGDVGHHAELRQLVTDLGLGGRVTFGNSPRDQLRSHYRAADALVFPSEWPEPFGLVPLEAMACGTPVIATGVGGSGEFLDDGVNCLLYPPGDAAALSATVQRLAADGDLRGRLVAGGLQTARGLTTDQYAEALLAEHRAAVQDSG